jgi:hypothetical protein
MPTGRKSPTGYIFAGLSLLVLGAAALLAYEAFGLVTGLVPPITWEVSRAYSQHLYAVFAVLLIVTNSCSLLVGHLFWAQQIPPWFRIYRRPARAIGLRVGPGPR